MKRVLSLILAAILAFALASCSNNKENAGNKETSGKDETNSNFQSYDDLEYKSSDSFEDDEILKFSACRMEVGSIMSVDSEGKANYIPLSDPESYVIYDDVVCPFGFSVGESMETLEEKFSLDTGFAAYVKKGGALQMYYEDKAPDISVGEGGCVYFGYAKNGFDKWGFMDYQMLCAVLANQLVIPDITDNYNVIVYSCIIGDDNNVDQITAVYGYLPTVMQLISN